MAVIVHHRLAAQRFGLDARPHGAEGSETDGSAEDLGWISAYGDQGGLGRLRLPGQRLPGKGQGPGRQARLQQCATIHDVLPQFQVSNAL